MTVTAKVMCVSRVDRKIDDASQSEVRFQPDYADDRNKDWAAATPHLEINMTLNGDAANAFEAGKRYTLTFEEEVGEPDQSYDQPTSNPFEEEEPSPEEVERDREEAAQAAVDRNDEYRKMQEESE